MGFPYLQKTSAWAAFSDFGRKLFLPDGIFYWSSKADAASKTNPNFINATIGVAEEDDGTIAHLPISEKFAGEAVMNRISKAKVFGYAPIQGFPPLRMKWKSHLLKNHPEFERVISLPVVTNGITEGIALAGKLFLEPGDILLTANKSWENYHQIFQALQGLTIQTFPLFTNGMFDPTALFEQSRMLARRQKKVFLLLNFPHNQTGFMPTLEEAKKLASGIFKLCEEFPEISWIIALDDAYEGYVYDDYGKKISILSEIFRKYPNLTLVKLDGCSKHLLLYGYRIGFITLIVNALDGSDFSPEFLSGIQKEIDSKLGGYIRGEISQVNHHGQIMADMLLEHPKTVESERQITLELLRTRWIAMMNTIESCLNRFGRDRLSVDPCNGGFFCYMNLSEGIHPEELAEELLERGVGVIPSAQGIRVAFCAVKKEFIPNLIEEIFDVVYKMELSQEV